MAAVALPRDGFRGMKISRIGIKISRTVPAQVIINRVDDGAITYPIGLKWLGIRSIRLPEHGVDHIAVDDGVFELGISGHFEQGAVHFAFLWAYGRDR